MYGFFICKNSRVFFTIHHTNRLYVPPSLNNRTRPSVLLAKTKYSTDLHILPILSNFVVLIEPLVTFLKWKRCGYNWYDLQSHIHWNSMSCILWSSFFAPFLLTFQFGARLKIKYFSLAFICHQDFCQPTSGAKTMSKIAIAVTNFETYFNILLWTILNLFKKLGIR